MAKARNLRVFVRTLLMGSLIGLLSLSASAAIFSVNTTSDTDDGNCDVSHCSLREAIIAANALPGQDAVIFTAMSPIDPRHLHYTDDGNPGMVSEANITATTEADDNDLVDADPDWAHS